MNNAMIDMLADVLDSTPDPLPFWEQSQQEADLKDRDDDAWSDYQCQMRTSLAWDEWQQECHDTVDRMADEVMYAPEPPVRLTGKIIAVEWEDVSRGGRWWETMDEGDLDRSIWRNKRCGVALSDVDEPVAPVAGPRW